MMLTSLTILHERERRKAVMLKENFFSENYSLYSVNIYLKVSTIMFV